MAAEYSFVTHWRIRVPREAVWEAIRQAERWPEWWQGLESVIEIKAGDRDRSGVGALRRFVWKSVLPYRLSFEMETTRAERPAWLEGRARGDLEGTGLWRFETEKDATLVRYDWNVRTNVPWMNWLTPLARPIFRWNHDALMRRGEAGLKRLFGEIQ